MPLVWSQIEFILAQAKAAGLSRDELDGIHDALVMRAAQPAIGDKLRMSIDLMPEAKRMQSEAFLADMAAIRDSVIARGLAELGTISDDEWDEVLGEPDQPAE